MEAKRKQYVLVTGGGTFLGDNIAAALLAEDAEVTLLVRPGAEDRPGTAADRMRWRTADVWDPASLKGRARGHSMVIHTVGSTAADPARGLSHHWLNFVSARNVANMCISDGVPHMVLLSSVRAPWLSGKYIRAKREAENYISRVGLRATIFRAPVVYRSGRRRTLIFRLIGFAGRIPPLSWFYPGKVAPLPAHVLARGVARIVLDPQQTGRIYHARELRRYGKAPSAEAALAAAGHNQHHHEHTLPDDDFPFGWTPPSPED